MCSLVGDAGMLGYLGLGRVNITYLAVSRASYRRCVVALFRLRSALYLIRHVMRRGLR